MMTLFTRIAAGHCPWLRILLEGYANVAKKVKAKISEAPVFPIWDWKADMQPYSKTPASKCVDCCKQARQRGRPAFGRICGLSVRSRWVEGRVAVIGLLESSGRGCQ
jgi:hypothetical protein